mmetsp:Transcript_8332/g.19993  ORF Transcript_8332/g.19993 Transcript_8332/m.19993 type:complete len:240 (-) Transcript_8332:510-1229(-)
MIRRRAPTRRSSTDVCDVLRRPSASHGTLKMSVSPAHGVGGGGVAACCGGATGTPSSSASSAITSSIGAKMRSWQCSSITVRCRLMSTVPPTAASRPARRAVLLAMRSAFMPQSDVPTATARSAVRSHSSRSSKRSVRSAPLIGTTGLSGEWHAPWISFITCCGSPAFCGRPSWFCWIRRCMWPARCSPTRTRCPRAGCAQSGDLYDVRLASRFARACCRESCSEGCGLAVIDEALLLA